jgi:hypothetical protein
MTSVILAGTLLGADPVLPPGDPGNISLWVKVVYTLFLAVLIPVYWHHYGPANFLWFSDLSLFLGLPALWLESPFLASMAAVSVLLPELVWLVDFLGQLLTGYQLVGLAAYMFDARLPRYLRALSLFHVPLPFFLVWLVWKLGYDRWAWLAQVPLCWLVLLATYFFTDPNENINWAFGPGPRPQHRLPSWAYLLVVMLFFPACIYLPTHLVLQAVFPPPGTLSANSYSTPEKYLELSRAPLTMGREVNPRLPNLSPTRTRGEGAPEG